MQLKENKKYNFLLKWGVIIIPLSIIILLIENQFVDDLKGGVSTYNNFFGVDRPKIMYVLFFLLGALLAPIYEEIIFRGNFIKNKVFKLISLGCLIIVGLIYSLNNYLIFGFLGIYLISFFLSKKKQSETRFKTVLVLNAILFSIMHNTIADYENFSTFSHSLQRLGIAFILLWITLNYKLIYSMIAHSIWNTILFSLVFYILVFPNDTVHQVENENLEVTWKTVNMFNNSRFESKDSLKYVYQTYLLKDVLKTSYLVSGEIDKKKNLEKSNTFKINDKTARYDFTIKLKDSTLQKKVQYQIKAFAKK